jgi:hypothetical protein
MKVNQVIKITHQGGLGKEDNQGKRILIRAFKDKVRMDFQIKRDIKKRPLLTRLTSYSRYNSDTIAKYHIYYFDFCGLEFTMLIITN